MLAVMSIGSVGARSRLDLRPVLPAQAIAGAADEAADPSAEVPPALPAPLAPASLHDANEALPGDAPPVASLTGYRWPLPHGRITLPFGPTGWGQWIVEGQAVHDGVDLATFCGDRVVAAHDGTVLAAGRHFDDLLGWVGDLRPYYARLETKKLWSTLPIVVVIDDGNGYRSMYAHFGKIVVKPGATVRAGDLLGYEGRTGHASGCHLHYGLFSPFEHDTFALDPGIAGRMKLPGAEIARVDPLLLFPPRPKAPKAVPTPTPVTDGGSAAR
jgi:murein DD-endopeptidase MepM/ murein hydrolase activator NlpD